MAEASAPTPPREAMARSRGVGVVMEDPICYHDCDCAVNTNVTQAGQTITTVNTIAERLKWARDRLGMTQIDLAKKAGVAQSTIGNIESGTRKNPRELLAIADAVLVYPAWLRSGKGPCESEQLEASPVAHGMSQPKLTVTPTTIEWGDLMETTLPAEFGLVIEDNSMAPDAPAGTLIWFERRTDARSPDWVLLVDDAGHWYIREYKERRPGHWEAHAVNRDFLPLDSIRDGLRVVAVYMGQKGRKG